MNIPVPAKLISSDLASVLGMPFPIFARGMCVNSSKLFLGQFAKSQPQKANLPQGQFAEYSCSFELFIKFTTIHIGWDSFNSF